MKKPVLCTVALMFLILALAVAIKVTSDKPFDPNNANDVMLADIASKFRGVREGFCEELSDLSTVPLPYLLPTIALGVIFLGSTRFMIFDKEHRLKAQAFILAYLAYCGFRLPGASSPTWTGRTNPRAEEGRRDAGLDRTGRT
jgi:hypothetical protein